MMFEVQQGQSWDFVIDSEDMLRLGTKLCVPDVHKLRKEILSKCFTCQQVKLEHQRKFLLFQQGLIIAFKLTEELCRS